MTGSEISARHTAAEMVADEILANESQIKGIERRKEQWESIDMKTAQLDIEIELFKKENIVLRQDYKEKLQNIIKGI